MTDTPSGEHWITRNIRAELARAGVTVAQARARIPLGEAAWSARMRQPGRWTLAELMALEVITGAPFRDLVREP